jgi:RNA polymerase sigma-70 factor (ECF subfamily)
MPSHCLERRERGWWLGIGGSAAASEAVNVTNEEFLRTTMPSMDLVYNIARRIVPRREDAEDLVQETYLAAFRAWQDHRRPRRVEPWLATICLNLGRSGYRHRARRPQEVSWEEMASFRAEADPETEAIAALDRSRVHRALWQISEEQRLAIALVDLGGFPTKEAARILEVPRGTILSRLHRGRKALAIILADSASDPERLEGSGP